MFHLSFQRIRQTLLTSTKGCHQFGSFNMLRGYNASWISKHIDIFNGKQFYFNVPSESALENTIEDAFAKVMVERDADDRVNQASRTASEQLKQVLSQFKLALQTCKIKFTRNSWCR